MKKAQDFLQLESIRAIKKGHKKKILDVYNDLEKEKEGQLIAVISENLRGLAKALRLTM